MDEHANHEIADHPLWRPFYCHTETVDQLLERTDEAVRKVRTHNCAALVSGALHYLRALYTAEVCRGEGLADFHPDEVAELAACDSPHTLPTPRRAGYNVYHAMPAIFDQHTPFTLANILQLHKAVGEGVVPGPGTFRRSDAAPLGPTRMYKAPPAIASSLAELVDRTNARLPAASLRAAICMATHFYSSFLMIHPFRDGNGRIARLCLSWLLREWCVVPVSLAAGGARSRDILLQCLELGERWDGAPLQLARFVLQSAAETASNVVYAADL